MLALRLIFLQQMQQQQYYDDWLDQKPHQSQSLFRKQVVNFTDEVIEANINRRMEFPILNQEFEDELDQEEQQNDHSNSTHTETTKQQNATSKLEALFNPLEDQENQQWTKKHCRGAKRPLTCPSCFNQIAFKYEIETQEEGTSYSAIQVFEVEVKENKIIRGANVGEKMVWGGVESDSAEKELKERQQAFNIKIVAQCTCGYPVGYFDINKQCYILTNMI